MQSFWDFWGFLKISCLVAKSEIGTKFYTILQNIWHLCWPRVRVHIEMGNLRARTPCVYSCLYLKWIHFQKCGYPTIEALDRSRLILDTDHWFSSKSRQNMIFWNVKSYSCIYLKWFHSKCGYRGIRQKQLNFRCRSFTLWILIRHLLPVHWRKKPFVLLCL